MDMARETVRMADLDWKLFFYIPSFQERDALIGKMTKMLECELERRRQICDCAVRALVRWLPCDLRRLVLVWAKIKI